MYCLIIFAELMLAKAHAEAEAWTKGKTKLTASKLVSNLSPLGVQAVVAERNELRFQLRKAADELRKVGILGPYLKCVIVMCRSPLLRVGRPWTWRSCARRTWPR